MPYAKGLTGAVSRRSSPVPVRFAIFVLGALLLYAVVQTQIDDVELTEIAPYFFFAIAVQLLPFVVRAKTDLFEPASLAGAQNLLVLVPALTAFIVQRGVSISMLPMVTGRSRIELVQMVAVTYTIGALSYFAGYYLRWGKRITGIFPDIAGRDWHRSRLWLVTAACAAIFIPAYAYFQARVGASLTDITQLAAGKAVWREDSTMSWLMRATGLGFIPILLFISHHFQKFKLRPALLSLFALFVVGFLATRLGQRGTALYIAISALMIVHYIWRRLPTTLIVAFAFGAMVMGNVLGSYRSNRDETTATMPGPTANFNAAETLVEHEDDRQRFAAMAVVLHHFPDRRDYLMGESWAAVATVPVPRWLWPEKTKYFVWRDTNIIPELVGRPVPVNFLAMLYANFSWVGVVLGMGLLGVYQRGMYEWLLKNQKDKNVVVYYSLAVLYLVPTLIQLSAALGYLVPVYVALLFIRKRLAKAPKPALPPRPTEPSQPALPLSATGPTAAE